MLTNGSQDVSDTTLLLQANLILSYASQQDVCELYYHLLARWLKGQQAVSDNGLAAHLIHIKYHGQQAVSDPAPVLQYYLIMTNRRWVTQK